MNNKYFFMKVENINSEAPEGKSVSFELEYYITESKLEVNENSENQVYGIEIVKTLSSGIVEKSTIQDIYCKKEDAQVFAGILASNSVTPVSLGYIVEDFLGV